MISNWYNGNPNERPVSQLANPKSQWKCGLQRWRALVRAPFTWEHEERRFRKVVSEVISKEGSAAGSLPWKYKERSLRNIIPKEGHHTEKLVKGFFPKTHTLKRHTNGCFEKVKCCQSLLYWAVLHSQTNSLCSCCVWLQILEWL